jgi:hypothetical protein
MYAGRDDQTLWGVGIFSGSVVLMIAAWVLLRPSVLVPIAGLTGSVRR